MFYSTKFIYAGILLLFLFSIKSTKSCGTIDEELVSDLKDYAAPTEHRWIGRVMLNFENSSLSEFECLGALITKRNLLAPAHCFVNYFGAPDAYSVQMGVWNKNADTEDWDCDDAGFCLPPPVTYKIKEIAVHPDYDVITFNNDIAVITLEEEVELNKYVETICIRPKALQNETLVGQHFHIGGWTVNDEIKSKGYVRTVSFGYCKGEYGDELKSLTDTQFCGYQSYSNQFDLGSPLVGTYVKDEKYQYFYLVGLLVEAVDVTDGTALDAFVDVRPYEEFIKRNVP